MPPIVRDLLLSKKFLVALFTSIAAFATYKGWSVDPMTILLMASPFLAYIGAQGWADQGKERAKIDGATAIQIQAMSIAHTLPELHSAAGDHQRPVKNPETGAASAHTALVTAAFGVVVVLAVFAGPGAATVSSGCAHPAQTVLSVGKCVLDDGVLGEVLAALRQPDYLKQVGEVGLKHAGELVDCALHAVASQAEPAPGSNDVLRFESAPGDTLPQRAREALAQRAAARG